VLQGIERRKRVPYRLRDREKATLVIGPAVLEKDPRCPEPPWLDMEEVLGLDFALNAVMLCDTPSARMNCSRSSMLVRPLAGVRVGREGVKIIIKQK
jgi:hypothetical protein